MFVCRPHQHKPALPIMHSYTLCTTVAADLIRAIWLEFL